MARKQGGSPKKFDAFFETKLDNPEYQKMAEERGIRVFRNSLYTVNVRPLSEGALHLSIKRNDRKVIRDWRHFQQIKNAIVGPEREAYEAYPAESSLVDEANQYHLWVLPEGVKLPWGFNERLVGSPEAAAKLGALQRPWEDPPPDVDAKLAEESGGLMQMRSS